MCTRDRVNNAGITRTGFKVTLAAIYLRRDRVVGVVPAVGIPWLRGGRAPASFSRCYAACACGTKTRRGPPAALPGADVWGHASGDGAHCRLHYPCTAAEPFFEPPPNHSFARVARVAADILACNKFSTHTQT